MAEVTTAPSMLASDVRSIVDPVRKIMQLRGVFAPDSTGAPPSIVAHIYDLKHPDDRNWEELPGKVVARIWNDFGPY